MSAVLPVGPPRLLDFSCQTCSKSSVTDAGDTSVSCLLKMKVPTHGYASLDAGFVSWTVHFKTDHEWGIHARNDSLSSRE
ncbi:unnamed protein product [Timema podura]|uniref:Uncharacterized protein n=1 Tax=Timema podura TaxID=61482 RepID=A0ABN7NII7_TIMPD|nr:unnamed protein product [Timema podura]